MILGESAFVGKILGTYNLPPILISAGKLTKYEINIEELHILLEEIHNKINPDEEYIQKSLAIWDYTKNNILDKKNGEWHFRVSRNGNAYPEEDKVSMWKAPYHTVRACILLNEN